MSLLERYRELCARNQAKAYMAYFQVYGRFPWTTDEQPAEAISPSLRAF